MQWLIKALCQGGHPTSIPKFVGVTRKGTVEVLLFYLCNLYCNLYFFSLKLKPCHKIKQSKLLLFLPLLSLKSLIFSLLSLLKNLNEIHL